MSETKTRARRRTVIGTVVSTKSTKTIGVERERRFMHPLYGKIVKKHKVLQAHDEQELAMEGDRVEIVETRPMSKTKRWRLVRSSSARAPSSRRRLPRRSWPRRPGPTMRGEGPRDG
jgi:small subunit ribosomal protein S17